jgi:hypothetical protein
VSAAITRAFLSAPWLAAVTWLVLHGTDWALTMRGATLRRRLFERAGVEARSAYELNPLFRNAVAQQRVLSPRFVVSWIGGAIVMYVAFRLLRQMDPSGAEFATAAGGFVLGALVFTRVNVILAHLRNIHVFGCALSMNSPAEFARAQFDQATNLWISARAKAGAGIVLGLATVLTNDPWLFGGTVGQAGLAAKHALLAWSSSRRRAIGPQSTGASGNAPGNDEQHQDARQASRPVAP